MVFVSVDNETGTRYFSKLYYQLEMIRAGLDQMMTNAGACLGLEEP